VDKNVDNYKHCGKLLKMLKTETGKAKLFDKSTSKNAINKPLFEKPTVFNNCGKL